MTTLTQPVSAPTANPQTPASAIRIPKACQVWKACADGTRYGINAPWLAENGDVFATDGRILAVVPATDPKGDSFGEVHRSHAGPLPTSAIKAAKGAVLGVSEDLAFELNGATTPRDRDVGKAPDYAAVIPKGQPVATVTLNAGLLRDLLDAIGAKGDVDIRIDLHGDRCPVTIRHEEPSDKFLATGSSKRAQAERKAYNEACDVARAFGVIMPVAGGK